MPACIVKWCRSDTRLKLKCPGITFHNFPAADPIRQNKWIAAVRLERGEYDWRPVKSSRVCSIHFDEKDFYKSSKGYTMLHKTAIPVCTMVRPEKTSESIASTSLGDITENEKLNNNERLQLADENSTSAHFFEVCDLPELLNKANTAGPQGHKAQKHKLTSKVSTSKDSKVFKQTETSKQPLDKNNGKKSQTPHQGYKCSECNQCNLNIYGFRYTCIQCDYNICSSCEALGAHPLHYVLRVPGQRPDSETARVCEQVRSLLRAELPAEEAAQEVPRQAPPADLPPEPEIIKLEAKQDIEDTPDPLRLDTSSVPESPWGVLGGPAEQTTLQLDTVKTEPTIDDEELIFEISPFAPTTNAPTIPIASSALIASFAPIAPTVSIASSAPIVPTVPIVSSASIAPTAPIASSAPIASYAPIASTVPIASSAPIAPTVPIVSSASIAPTNPIASSASIAPTNPIASSAPIASPAPIAPSALSKGTRKRAIKGTWTEDDTSVTHGLQDNTDQVTPKKKGKIFLPPGWPWGS